MARTIHGLPGVYNQGVITLSDGEGAALALNSSGITLIEDGYLTWGENSNLERMMTADICNYTNITADTLIKTGAGIVFGLTVNSHTTGAIKFWDNTSAATTVLIDTYTFAAGSSVIVFPAAYQYTTGLYADVTGTVNLTIAWL